MESKRLTIMHVEDNNDHAELVSAVATGAKLAGRIIRFVDAESGLDYLSRNLPFIHRHQQPFPDLILLDLTLPGMSGLMFLKHLRANKQTKGIPVVVLTESEREDDIAASYRFGANSYIVKSMSMEEFIIKLAELNMYWSLTAEVPRLGAAMSCSS